MNDGNQRPKIWKIAGLAAVLLVLLIGLGRPAYRHFKARHDLAQAQGFFARGDYRNASISVRQALMINSNDAEACRIMASLYDLAHSPATLDWWRRVVAIDPKVGNQLQLALVGLRYQGPPYPLTTQILNDLSASASNLPVFQVVSARFALSLGRVAEAELHFAAAARLEPTNRLYQLNLAVIRLNATNQAVAEAARETLVQLGNDAALKPDALRSLVSDRLLHGDTTAAAGYATRLLADARATTGDRLQYLGILRRLQSPQFSVQLTALQQRAATNAAMAAEVASWMKAGDTLPDALRWLKSLPPATQTQLPVRLALAGAYFDSGEWRALRDFTVAGNWGEADFLRLAFLSRAWSRLGEPLVADASWRSAIGQAGERFGALAALLDLAGRWGLEHGREDLLWRIIQKFPGEHWPQMELAHLYFAAGNTAGLNQLYARQFFLSPGNAGVKNNLAATDLLLKTNLSQAFVLAAEAHAGQPANATIASTCAYALHLQGRTRDGLAIFQKMTAGELEQPAVALYYGILLSAAGDAGDAARFLEIARTNASLLPEEKTLLDQAAGKR